MNVYPSANARNRKSVAPASEQLTRSGRRFERGRPIRRANSKPRNSSYTTSIFVSTPHGSYDNLDNESQLDYGSSSSSNTGSELNIAEQKKNAVDVKSEAGTLRIVLESSPKKKRDSATMSKESEAKGGVPKDGVRLLLSADPDDLSYV